MIIKGIIKKDEYFDSVTLMLIAKQLSEMNGVIDSAVLMGTSENLKLLKHSGLFIEEFSGAGDSDLLISVKSESSEGAGKILEKVTELLKTKNNKSSKTENLPLTIDSALELMPDANMVLISVAGRFAGDLAKESLEKGLNVMLFSDNIPVEKEIEIKSFAASRGLLVMGPDCGTAIINGTPLAFANVVNKGDIGIVAASGTGLQEVSTIISNMGFGISQAIGTGGRDVKKEVGGIMFLEGMKLLAADKSTNVILLVSKPPADEVMEKIVALSKEIYKPIIGVFIGSRYELPDNCKILIAETLEEGALLATEASAIGHIPVKKNKLEINENIHIEAKELVKKLNKKQKYLRGLYSGGTFCDEALNLCKNNITDVFTNTPFAHFEKLKNLWVSEKNTIIDMGDDDFTVGKPHPMIDYTARCKRVLEEIEDEETAVLLFDLVLGYGSNENPADEFIPALKEAKNKLKIINREVVFICSVTGTEKDPQNRKDIISILKETGVIVKESNAAASVLAIEIIKIQNSDIL